MSSKPTLGYYVCECCDATGYLPRDACPMCGHTRYERRQSVGRGTVLGLTRLAKSGGEDCGADINVCLAELDERFHALGRCGDDVRIGDRVSVRSLTKYIPVFDTDTSSSQT